MSEESGNYIVCRDSIATTITIFNNGIATRRFTVREVEPPPPVLICALIERALATRGEVWADVEAHTLTEDQLAERWCEYERLPDFTVWTARHVYYPGAYSNDGEYSSHICCVSRHPDGKPTETNGNEC